VTIAASNCWNEGQSHDFIGGKCMHCGRVELDDQLERGVEHLRRKIATELETPEFDALLDDLTLQVEHESIEPSEYDKRVRDFARSLERRLSLAQTEIKGHMRIEDELKFRIAELEKLLRKIMACPRSDPNRGKGRWFSVMAKTGLIERIAEALKDRA